MDPTDEINKQLDDMLLDDLIDAQEQLGGSDRTGNLTPGQAVYNDRRDKIVETELTRIGKELGVDESTLTTAKVLFDQFASDDKHHGHALEVLAAACLYTACKVEAIGLSPDDFAAVPETAFTRVVLLRRVKKISSALGLDPRAFFDPHAYVDRYCDELGLNGEITDRAHEVIDIADEAGISGGKSPTGLAAAAIYNAVLENGRVATQSDISEVADVSEVTIRNRYQEQRECLQGGSIYRSSNDRNTNTSDGHGNTPETDETGGAISTSSTNSGVNDEPAHDLVRNIGENVAENIETALTGLDETHEELNAQTEDLCRRLAERQNKAEFGTDDVTLALAIIRIASEELDDPISYPTLMRTLERGEDKVYRVSKLIRNKI